MVSAMILVASIREILPILKIVEICSKGYVGLYLDCMPVYHKTLNVVYIPLPKSIAVISSSAH